MLSVAEARQKILGNFQRLRTDYVDLPDSLGRVLGEDIHAPHDLPPFANSSMDGYAVRVEDVQSGILPITLHVIEDIPAGYQPRKTVQAGQAARIMTGAPIPKGADAVVPVEQTDVTHNGAELPQSVQIMEGVSSQANVRPIGEDIRAGELILSRGKRLRPADLGVLAGLGISKAPVVQRPLIAIMSTGDELLLPNQPLTPGKIRDINGYVVPALVETLGGSSLKLGIAHDNVEDIRARLQKAIDLKVDLIVSSAGVSVGAFDVIKTVLNELGTVNFWKVNMRPGKPLIFGHVADIPFIGLPGNPVSAMVTFLVFVRPIIAKMLGLDPTLYTRAAYVTEAIKSDGRETYMRVRLERKNGELFAFSTGTQSSGAISSMVKADGLLIIPAGVHEVEAGETLEVWPFDW